MHLYAARMQRARMAVGARVEPADRPNYDNRRQIVRNAKQAWHPVHLTITNSLIIVPVFDPQSSRHPLDLTTLIVIHPCEFSSANTGSFSFSSFFRESNGGGNDCFFGFLDPFDLK